MAEDPYASEKRQRVAETLAVLAAVYAAARVDVLRSVSLGQVRNPLPARWRDRVREVVREQAEITTSLVGRRAVSAFTDGRAEFDIDRAAAFLDKFADEFAKAWDAGTTEALNTIDLRLPDLDAAAAEVMDAVINQAPTDAEDITQRAANLGLVDAGKAAGATTKTWLTGTNPRPTHAALNGVTVPIDERFPNGLRFPGAPGPPSEVAGCNCSLRIGGFR